jgi:hypothetical protein
MKSKQIILIFTVWLFVSCGAGRHSELSQNVGTNTLLINYHYGGKLHEIYDYAQGEYYEFFWTGGLRKCGAFDATTFKYHFDKSDNKYYADRMVPVGLWRSYSCYGQLKKECYLSSKVFINKDTLDDGGGLMSVFYCSDFEPDSCIYY